MTELTEREALAEAKRATLKGEPDLDLWRTYARIKTDNAIAPVLPQAQEGSR